MKVLWFKVIKRHVWFVGVVARFGLVAHAHDQLMMSSQPYISLSPPLGVACKTRMHISIALNFEFGIL